MSIVAPLWPVLCPQADAVRVVEAEVHVLEVVPPGVVARHAAHRSKLIGDVLGRGGWVLADGPLAFGLGLADGRAARRVGVALHQGMLALVALGLARQPLGVPVERLALAVRDELAAQAEEGAALGGFHRSLRSSSLAMAKYLSVGARPILAQASRACSQDFRARSFSRGSKVSM